MKRIIQKAGCLAAAALLAAGSLTACARAPQPRPDTTNVPGLPANPATDIGEAVKGTIATVAGAGPAEAVVLGNIALVALNTDGDPNAGFGAGPGPREGGATGVRETPLTSPNVGGPGARTSPPAAPDATANRPGLTHIAIGQPGGQISAGPAVPGGTPTGTGATPNVTGQPGLVGTGTTGTTNAPGQGGTAADLYVRVSDAVRDRFPWIAEVRFAVRREDATRLAAIATEMRNGTPVTDRLDDLHDLARNMSPTSTTATDVSPPAFGEPTPGVGPAAPGVVPPAAPGTGAPAPGAGGAVPGGMTGPPPGGR